MQSEFNNIYGRIGVLAAIFLVLLALGLYFYSERAVPPEAEMPVSGTPESETQQQRETRLEPESVRDNRDGPSVSSPAAQPLRSDEIGTRDPKSVETESSAQDVVGGGGERLQDPDVSLEQAQQRLREDLEARLGPGQMEIVVEDRLLERLVATVNSIDDEPVPLRFRPLDHVPDLPRLEETDEHAKLPEEPDPRYRPYRAMFDRLDAVELAEMFDHYEPALEQAWQDLGEHSGKRFRSRLIEVLNHLAEFELPRDRPAVHQPEVLYEYIDPELEQLSWGRKALIRIGPEHASEVQRKLGELADELARRQDQAQED